MKNKKHFKHILRVIIFKVRHTLLLSKIQADSPKKNH